MDELRDPWSSEIPPTSGIDDPSELLDERHPTHGAGHFETDVYATLPVHERPAARACVEAAKKDLSVRVGVGHDEITLESITRHDWPDSSLGVPQQDMMYAQMIVAGYLIQLRSNGQIHTYHSDTHGTVVAAN